MAPLLRGLPVALCAIGLVVALHVAADAQGAPPTNPTNQPTGNQTPPSGNQAVRDFLAKPNSLLSQFPVGGGSMVSAVRDLAMADPATVQALLGLVASATPDQKNAIGDGLGLAALQLARSNPQLATAIQDAIVKLNDPAVLASYAAVTGNQRLAAAGPGGGGGGGSPGGGESQTGGAGANGGIGSPSSLFSNFGTNNTADTFTFPGLTSSSPGTPGNTTITIITVNNSVSQTTP